MRSTLTISGLNPDLLRKALAGAADAVCVDLADSVGAQEKAVAREQAASFLRSPQALASDKLIIVRVNPPGSAELEADLAAVALPGLGMVNLPQVESAADIAACARLLTACEAANGLRRPLAILADIASARALRQASVIAEASSRVVGLQLDTSRLFGASGIARHDRGNLQAALFQLRLAAAEAGVFACDGPFANLADSAGFVEEARIARRLGYWGKQCLHPRQVVLANSVFGIDPAELAQARRIVTALAAAERAGQGSCLLDGQTVSPPLARRAQQLVAAAAERDEDEEPGYTADPDASAPPLAGVRVLDLSAYIAGPYGCTILADMGAEVVKVEPPAGDQLRRAPSTLAAASRAFLGINRSKRGMVIDLGQAEGLAVLLTLVDSADVLVHSFEASVAARLGIDYASLRQRRPALVYCAISPYGDDGPLRERAGDAGMMAALTGLDAPDGGASIDYYAASMVASGVSAALYGRAQNGQGRYVGVSLLRSALALQSHRLVWAASEPLAVERELAADGISGLHPTADGQLYLAADSEGHWQALCAGLGLAALAADPRYASAALRSRHAQLLLPQLRAALATRPALEWEQRLAAELPCAASRPPESVFSHPQVLAEQMITTIEHAELGEYQGLGAALRFGEGPPPAPLAAPALGQHTAELLVQQGYAPAEIERLRQLGVIQ